MTAKPEAQDPTPLPPGEGRGEGAESPGLPTSEHQETQWFGVIVALGAWTMFFAALAFTVGYLRMRDPWPSEGALTVPRFLPIFGLFLLGGGSGLLRSAHQHLRHETSARGPALRRTFGALALGVAFLSQQAGLASVLWEDGLRLPSGGAHASAFYGLMAVHALHAGVGLIGLARVAMSLAQGSEVRQRLRLWTLYWHFVTVTGLLYFAAVYLP